MLRMWRQERALVVSQQTRDFPPLLGQCWADVVDGGPTLTHHWAKVPCLLGWLSQIPEVHNSNPVMTKIFFLCTYTVTQNIRIRGIMTTEKYNRLAFNKSI